MSQNNLSNGPQRIEPTKETVDTASQDHMMPGLVDPLVDTFLTPRKHFTTRGVARRKRVAETFVQTALFRDLYREITELRGMVARKPAASELTAREALQIVRRSA